MWYTKKKGCDFIEKYIDSHAHYLSYKFNTDRDTLLKKLFATSTDKIVECGTNSYFNQQVIELTKKYENLYGVIGFFPVDVPELEINPKLLDTLAEQCQKPKILGIGEIGLDYHHNGDHNIQAKWFKAQLELAKSLNMPVCIHSREAEHDTLRILQDFGPTLGVIHCYSYGVKTMKVLLDLGYYFGVGGTSTYQKNADLREAIKLCPMERILLETDAPYLSPYAVRRTRNDSSNIHYVIKELTSLKGIPEEKIIEATNSNCYKVYNKLRK